MRPRPSIGDRVRWQPSGKLGTVVDHPGSGEPRTVVRVDFDQLDTPIWCQYRFLEPVGAGPAETAPLDVGDQHTLF